MKNEILYIVILFNLVVFGLSWGEKQSGGNAIDNAENAVERAVRYIGLDSVDGFKITKSPKEIAKAVIMKDSTTAFLADSISGRPAWRVEFDAVPVGERKAKVEAFLDSCTSLPLRIVFRFEDVGYREPTAREATMMLSDLHEKYTGLPTVESETTIIDIIDNCRPLAVAAKEIIVSYIMYTRDDYTMSLPAWVVYLRGTPPVADWNTPLYQRTNMRYVINAQTGDGLSCNNWPIPLLEND